MIDAAFQFAFDGVPTAFEPCGGGHINTTYRVTTKEGRDYTLQRINRYVFTDPPALMRSITAVTEHLRKHGAVTLTVIPAADGRTYYRDADGEYWRAYEYFADCVCLEQAGSPADLYESGAAFGRFQRDLTDFNAMLLAETIPRFHDTPHRYEQLKTALQSDPLGRAGAVAREIDFALAREKYAHTLVNLQARGELPVRVTHNDTKLNNVLFDKDTGKAVCVIDLDTVMPGLAVNDFGDSVRFGASAAAEDERDLNKVWLSLELFEACAKGYLSSCNLTAAERECLCDGAKMMTLECGVRFLTDYIGGDTYFRVSYTGQNLDRCRTQFKLVADMESKWDVIRKILEKR